MNKLNYRWFLENLENLEYKAQAESILSGLYEQAQGDYLLLADCANYIKSIEAKVDRIALKQAIIIICDYLQALDPQVAYPFYRNVKQFYPKLRIYRPKSQPKRFGKKTCL